MRERMVWIILGSLCLTLFVCLLLVVIRYLAVFIAIFLFLLFLVMFIQASYPAFRRKKGKRRWRKPKW
ncbi:hypothetical protein AAC03nite_01000 [Alicyclobacillus acidoterrestris]|uniref:hypothetical protein n=1 Tax=Alicyclobacillus suci TaxID=2816080 RepID=UPI001197978F|nr:hypothetical protein [Alicyclobacillus suci]GEO24315.1 hypothetical protein AAC03nite_01000 [Alicyclobacillus acidoterrestris]